MNHPKLLLSPILAASMAWALSACASYEPRPLPDWSTVIDAVSHEPTDEFTLSSAVGWLLEHNERLSVARGAWRTARDLAQRSTPVANPSFSIGPVFLSGVTGLASSQQAFEAALGWVIPLSGVRKATDALDDAKARAARQAAIVVAREEYLALRGELLRLSVQIQRARHSRKTHGMLQAMAEQQRGLGAAGSSMDLYLAELDAVASDSQAAGHEAAVLASRGAVAGRCGAAVDRVADLPLRVIPELPEEIPPVAVLISVLQQHPDLVALREDYHVSERALRREVRKQYPDLAFGGSYEREEGGKRLALPLGIELPLFDSNQQGIAEAAAVRTAIREKYILRVRGLQRTVDLARSTLVLQQSRYRLIGSKVAEMVATIRSSVEVLVAAGRMGGRQRAEVFRRVFEAQAAELDAREAVLQSWSKLEQACGAPLLQLPGQPATPSSVEIK